MSELHDFNPCDECDECLTCGDCVCEPEGPTTRPMRAVGVVTKTGVLTDAEDA